MEKTIGERIARLLREKKYTQKELAELVGVTEASMSRYLKDEREPKMQVIANLATALGTTSDFLISGKEEKENFNRIKHLVARGAKDLTREEKMELMRLLIEDA